ncbi:MAG: DUF1566 domain-containing protein [Rhodoferax sp.]|nr:DUF1566 domain-containing protein [Rhodoferax sp.]
MTKLKLFATLVACVIGIVLTACGGGGGGGGGGGSVTTPPVETPPDPSITTQPASQTVAVGQTASFSVVATGTAPLRYQWKLNDQAISGATSSSYATSDTNKVGNDAVFTVVVSNGTGTVTSDKATLTVTPVEIPAITTHPLSQSAAAGQTASFSVVATGTKPLSYQWKRKNATDGESINIEGATSSTYTLTTKSGDNGAKFSVVVSNSAGSVTSNEADLSDVAIAMQLAAQSVVVGQTARFSVTATGTGPWTYQWKKNGTNVSTENGVPVTTGAGGSISIYTTPATVIEDNGAVYSVEVRNNSAGTVSSSATLSVFAERYRLVPNGASTYTKEECVKDNTTGLIWEGKPVDGGLRDAGKTYTNVDNPDSKQKWDGISPLDNAVFVNPTPTEISASTNSIGYVNDVNATSLCGFTDWRLPTKDELVGILETSGNPKIDTKWFPNTQDWWYWSSSPYVVYPSQAWAVHFDGDGYATYHGRSYHNGAVRLVRASQ